MKKYFLIALLSIGLGSCQNSCQNENPIIPKEKVIIYGFVQDKYTSEFLSDVSIYSDSLQIGNIVTGSDGIYEFTLAYSTSRIINLTAQKLNYESSTQMLNLEDLIRNPNKSVNFQLCRSAIIYKGTVTDAQTEQPIPNAKVHAKIQNGSTITAAGTVFTDETGHYTLELHKPEYNSWNYYISADKSDYKVQTYTMSHTKEDIGRTVTLNFQLETK